jgi:cytochrome P450
LILLGGYPEWREKAKVEMESLVATHATPGLVTASLSSALASIPLDVWENNTPVLDSVIREMLRVSQPHTAMRQNLGPEMHIDGKRIRTGDYVIYPFYDVHLNPDIYSEPHKFDPSRREEIKSAYGYIGWGAGEFFSLSC